MSRHWSPAMQGVRFARRPEPGGLIAIRRKPWRVIEVNELDSEEFEYEIVVTPLDGDRQHVASIPRHAWDAWSNLPEHFAICHSCGELAPCREHERGIYAAEQSKRMDRELQLLPGCCPACQEPITSRQQTIDFPGEYVHNPLAPAGPRFHTRMKCRGGAERYEAAWVAADPTRKRSLLTLACDGSVVVHGDGSAECFGAENSDCPSVHARHRSHSACYIQSLGCPRDCPTSGHPGTRISNHPTGLRL